MGLAIVAAVAAVFGIAQSPRPPRPPFDPNMVPGTQVVWVTAPPGADHGVLELWQQNASAQWERTLTTPAWVGAQGISNLAHEGSAYTPAGIFPLTEGFGRKSDVTADLPYLAIAPSDTWWWVSDSESPLYNQKYRCHENDCPFDTTVSENLGSFDPQYDYALVIDYNRFPTVPTLGSAFFLHVEDGGPTAGCVAITAEAMRTLVTTLRSASTPAIALYPS